MPLTYWPHAMTTTAYLINRLPTPILGYLSPYSKLLNISPYYHKLKCFGCLCFPWIKPYANHKLTPKFVMCVFVGYSDDQHAYLCLDPLRGRIYTSRHVKFVESEFPFRSLVTRSNPSVEHQPGPLQLSILPPTNQPMVSTTLNSQEDLPTAPSYPSITHSPDMAQTSTSNEPTTTTTQSPLLPHHPNPLAARSSPGLKTTLSNRSKSSISISNLPLL